jgi:c-di-GMP-binding flagellar brake protein YcgR
MPNRRDRRSAERVPVPAGNPIYIQTVLDGTEIGLLVENLSSGGATLICPDMAELLSDGEYLPESTLVLPDIRHIPVQPVVRWRMWPRVGVQFESLSSETQKQISQFLEGIKPVNV